ncbi:MAG: tetratricopeptide repeat protein [Acidobacteriaceae bacterium]|jgi:tetratricopeptide (TPR) repeat protein
MPPSATSEADAALDAALDQMAAGKPAAAIPHLHRALTLTPNHPAATHALLRALEDTNQISEALTLARACIAHSPDDVLAHTRLSILLQKSGDIHAAEAAAARARILDWKLQLRPNIQSAGSQAE